MWIKSEQAKTTQHSECGFIKPQKLPTNPHYNNLNSFIYLNKIIYIIGCA